MYLVTHFYGVKYRICFSHFFIRLQTMFLILQRLAIWLWDAETESHCLLVTSFHSSPTTELKACRVTPLPTHTDKNTQLTGRHMWAIHHRVQLCVYDRKADRGWMKRERQQENVILLFLSAKKKSCQLGIWREGGELTSMWLETNSNPRKRSGHLSLRGLCGKASIFVEVRRWKLWAVRTCGKGGLKYAGQIGLCQLCLQSYSDGLIEPDMTLHLWLPLWLGLSSHSLYSHLPLSSRCPAVLL